MTHILLVEDETGIADFVRRGLVYKGYVVEVASSGEEALEKAHQSRPALVVLDLMLPGIDGIEVCRRLRAADDLPIIILTARDAVSDKVEGLEAGADDYVTKPFAFEELLARVRAALRRKSSRRGSPMQVADLVIEPARREVRRGDRPVSLTPREYELLEYLARHPGEVITKEELFEKVWGYDFSTESDVVKVYISYLRKKLNAGGAEDLIRAVRGVGYALEP